MSTKIFVILPVKNLNKSMDFFKKLGFGFDSQFTKERGNLYAENNPIFMV